MHFVSAKVAVKTLSQRVLYILCLDAHLAEDLNLFDNPDGI